MRKQRLSSTDTNTASEIGARQLESTAAYSPNTPNRQTATIVGREGESSTPTPLRIKRIVRTRIQYATMHTKTVETHYYFKTSL